MRDDTVAGFAPDVVLCFLQSCSLVLVSFGVPAAWLGFFTLLIGAHLAWYIAEPAVGHGAWARSSPVMVMRVKRGESDA